MKTELIPAILTSSVEDLARKLDLVRGKTPWVQIDIMDGSFVFNQSITVDDVTEYARGIKLEAHLMVLHPEMYIDACKKAGFERIVFHYEAVPHIEVLLEKISKAGMERGIAINPETPITSVLPYLSNIDTVLLLGVIPGLSGQMFHEPVLEKINDLQQHAKSMPIGIDGGIDLDNASRVIVAGADRLIVGSAIFGAVDPNDALKQFQSLVSPTA